MPLSIPSGMIIHFNKSDIDAAPYQQVKQSTQYLDGLGRPLQTVMRQVTPGNDPKDMIVPFQYDGYGRDVYKYLPYIQTTGSAATTSDGSFKMDPFNSQDNFYKNVYKDANGKIMYDGEKFLYGQSDFEPSPLNRIKKVKSPGNSWTGKDKGVTKQHLVNTALDAVHIWTIGNSILTIGNQASTNIPVSLSSAVYDAGQLYKNVTEDENGNAVVEYKDKQDQVVLKKVQGEVEL